MLMSSEGAWLKWGRCGYANEHRGGVVCMQEVWLC